METPLTSDPGTTASGPQALHVPTEVCENIIDMLYSKDLTRDTHHNIATLYSCALVCQAWRVRSQRMLFYKIQLDNMTSLHRLAAILDDRQHLRDYVQEVELTGHHLHTTISIFALFPALFARKLPSLKWINVIPQVEAGGTESSPRRPDPPKFKVLPYIPLHPHFPAFLSSFTALSVLYLSRTTFRSFTEFARVLRGIPNLEELTCDSVRWLTLGGSHPDADFTVQPDWESRRSTSPAFAPKLSLLCLRDMPRHGVERLIWTRSPYLKSLELTIPLSIDIGEQDDSGGLDLSSCTGLQILYLSLDPHISMDKHTALVTQLLASWKPRCPAANLVLLPIIESAFTRNRFAGVLRALGTTIEAWLQTVEPSPGAGEPKNCSMVQYQLRVVISDWEAKREWWSNHLGRCFPTFARLKRLRMNFHTPRDKCFEWASELKDLVLFQAIPPQSESDPLTTARQYVLVEPESYHDIVFPTFQELLSSNPTAPRIFAYRTA